MEIGNGVQEGRRLGEDIIRGEGANNDYRLGVLTTYILYCSYLSILFGVPPSAGKSGFVDIHSPNGGHRKIPNASLFAVYLHRIFCSTSFIFTAKSTLFDNHFPGISGTNVSRLIVSVHLLKYLYLLCIL